MTFNTRSVHRWSILVSLLIFVLALALPVLAQPGDEPAPKTRQVGKTQVTFHFINPASDSKVRLSEDLRKVLEARLEGREAPLVRKSESEILADGMTKATVPVDLFNTMMGHLDAEGEPASVCSDTATVQPTAIASSRQEVE
jgi:hypothetical protein